MSWKISLAQVQSLLNSPELDRVEAKIVEQTHAEILPAISSAMSVWAELSLADMTEDDFTYLLSDGSGLLIEFGRRIQQMENSDEEEYAKGEEPSLDETGRTMKVLGYAKGFGLTYACYLNFLRRNSPTKFLEFLKARRIPQAKKFHKQLESLYRGIEGK